MENQTVVGALHAVMNQDVGIDGIVVEISDEVKSVFRACIPSREAGTPVGFALV